MPHPTGQDGCCANSSEFHVIRSKPEATIKNTQQLFEDFTMHAMVKNKILRIKDTTITHLPSEQAALVQPFS